ncbi:MAG TPA: hypothetical protein VF665_02525 [Longimicrobium sp.]|jgi:hypothetical protein|uniref:hypothetical protein n=1 Tax=Longimicrobium sp. TaxID=2029185 RepID=UPI002ED8CECF
MFDEDAEPDSGDEDSGWEDELTAAVRGLLGCASGAADENDYKEYLWRKYGG